MNRLTCFYFQEDRRVKTVKIQNTGRLLYINSLTQGVLLAVLHKPPGLSIVVWDK